MNQNIIRNGIMISMVLSMLCCHAYAQSDPAEIKAQFESVGLQPKNAYPPRKVAARYGAVLLMPDLFETPAVFDLDRQGLAPYLAERDFAVFTLDWQQAPKTDFDVLLNDQLPRALEIVRANTNREQPLFLIGHGFGAMAALVYAANHPGEIDGVIGLGATGRMLLGNEIFDKLIALEKSLPEAEPVPVKKGADFRPFSHMQLSALDILLANGKDWEPARRQRYLSEVPADLPRPLAQQMIGWAQTHSFTSVDGTRDYYKEIDKLSAPVLLIAGNADNIADPLESIEMLKRIHGGKLDLRALRILSEVNHNRDNYGHAQMLTGAHAEKDVFKPIAKWLKTKH